jgi:hypothetical protein
VPGAGGFPGFTLDLEDLTLDAARERGRIAASGRRDG